MRIRKVGVCAVAVLALVALAGCGTKAGAAAFVGDHRISQSELGQYVVTGAVAKSGQQPPRTIALATLIQQDLFERALAASGGVPSADQLAAYHDSALSSRFQQQVAGAAGDTLLRQQAGQAGLTSKFDPVFVRTLELGQALVAREKITSLQQLTSEITKLDVPVSVNARFGTWNASQFGLEPGIAPELSPVLTLGPTSSASPSP